MLTEPSGFHALRSTEWNAVNGNERRTLSGVQLSHAYAQFSIVSSTPLPDPQFGNAFQLFIPLRVVYGNPSSHIGTVFVDVSERTAINIRTFDHRYADPNTGGYQNNQYFVNVPDVYRIEGVPLPTIALHPNSFSISNLREELWHVITNKDILDRMSDDVLVIFLKDVFWSKRYEQF
jgi:hypothetical protein